TSTTVPISKNSYLPLFFSSSQLYPDFSKISIALSSILPLVNAIRTIITPHSQKHRHSLSFLYTLCTLFPALYTLLTSITFALQILTTLCTPLSEAYFSVSSKSSKHESSHTLPQVFAYSKAPTRFS